MTRINPEEKKRFDELEAKADKTPEEKEEHRALKAKDQASQPR